MSREAKKKQAVRDERVSYFIDNKLYKGTGNRVVYGVYPRFACPLTNPYTYRQE